jgi:CarboxypepD_reg-like domain
MNWIRCALFLFLMAGMGSQLWAQQKDSSLVQFSGLVLDGTNEQLQPIPYANIFIKNKGRGTYTDLRGFFSIVVHKDDVVRFSAVGYRTVEYRIPRTLTDDRYSLVQLMTLDTINLPETVVFPWPSREHFRLEFLNMDVTSELQRRAAENVAEASLRKAQAGVKYDGDENADFYLRKQASSYYYYGQAPPMNIFNPIAWGKFFKAWKNGEFKKKDN